MKVFVCGQALAHHGYAIREVAWIGSIPTTPTYREQHSRRRFRDSSWYRKLIDTTAKSPLPDEEVYTIRRPIVVGVAEYIEAKFSLPLAEVAAIHILITITIGGILQARHLGPFDIAFPSAVFSAHTSRE